MIKNIRCLDNTDDLLHRIGSCRVCEESLSAGARPVVAASASSKIVIVGQAPGRIVHRTGIPWNDKSGDTLREWLGVGNGSFYDTNLFALIPMGFCYPGKGKSGDLPPRRECAPLWQEAIMNFVQQKQLVLLIGQYAQKYYLGSMGKDTLTETVRHYFDYLPDYFPLPHPSPRNNIWQARNRWFGEEVVPALRNKVREIL